MEQIIVLSTLLPHYPFTKADCSVQLCSSLGFMKITHLVLFLATVANYDQEDRLMSFKPNQLLLAILQLKNTPPFSGELMVRLFTRQYRFSLATALP